MPLYIPWLTETIKKRGVRYLLHHYLGQFFEEKLTLEQLSIDIYEGKGSIRNLALDVDGLNDELDFIPFRFLDGCLIGQISVEVPWSSLATDACKVELNGAKFYCRLKTSADAAKPHCTESTLLSRSLMTSSMQMAEEIVTTEDDEESDYSSINHHNHQGHRHQDIIGSKTRKDANQMFEGLEMFAQLIDSVLRRTKLTAHNTLFQIKPYHEKPEQDDDDDDENETSDSNETSRRTTNLASSSRSSVDEFSEPLAKSGTDDDEVDDDSEQEHSKNTVEFFIKFFRCEEMIDHSTRAENGMNSTKKYPDQDDEGVTKSLSAIPETITKLLTLEDVEMRIDGIPVSNLVGKHTITIKFNGQKSEISIFSGSPLLAVISHKQLETFFNVFDSVKDQNSEASYMAEKDQKLMSPEDYAKIENQLLETAATLRGAHANDHLRSTTSGGVTGGGVGGFDIGRTAKSMLSGGKNSYYGTSQVFSGTGGDAKRWVDSGDVYSEASYQQQQAREASEYANFHHSSAEHMKQSCETATTEPTLDHIEAFSCELKLPGIWLCILRAGQSLPPLIKPFADSINSFQSINKYIDSHIKVPHIRFLALKVALDITASATNVFLGDLDISEYLEDHTARMSPFLKILNNDQANVPMSSSRYKASIKNGKEITIDLLTKTRLMFDPTIIDRIVYDYKLLKLDNNQQQQQQQPNLNNPSSGILSSSQALNLNHPSSQRANHGDINLTVKAEQFKVELLCPIPDLTPEALTKRTQLRPQSFIFDFKDLNLTWRMDQLKMSSNELMAFVKSQPKQLDVEAVKFVEATCKGNDKIILLLEPSPSNLDNDFTNDIERALNESSMYESIYVSQATESRIPTEPFQTKRKVVRASFQSQQTSNKPNSARISECDHEKILTPGDRQHLLEYLNQTLASTKLSLNLHLPVCEVEFEDKEQLDLIYNRFGNDFVFWQPKTFAKDKQPVSGGGCGLGNKRQKASQKRAGKSSQALGGEPLEFKPANQYGDYELDKDQLSSDADNEGSEHSYHSMSQQQANDETDHKLSSALSGDIYDNEVTCKIVVDELFVRFNHQSCAAALKQEISANNLLLGVVIDVNKKPNTLLSLVADNLELSNELETVLEGNFFCNKESVFGLTAEIRRPTRALKNIKLAIQLRDGLFNDFRTETYTRFWQSINVTDEPILGYVAPQIVTELHIDILNIGLLLVREGARPALLSIDELYLTSMVMEQTSQVMIRLIADEVSLYMKRDRQGLEVMKNYICLVDSGLIDLDVKLGNDDNRLEFNVINNVITVRVCQDSLSALCKLFNVLVRSANQTTATATTTTNATNVHQQAQQQQHTTKTGQNFVPEKHHSHGSRDVPSNQSTTRNAHNEPAGSPAEEGSLRNREINLLVDAMNDYTISPPPGDTACNKSGKHSVTSASGRCKGSATPLDVSDRCAEAATAAAAEGDKVALHHSHHHDGDDDNGAGSNRDRDLSSAGERSASEDDDHDDDDDEEEEEEGGEENCYSEYDSDAPPAFQPATSTHDDEEDEERRLDDDSSAVQHTKPSACLLDESNPMLANLFSQPLMPTSEQRLNSSVLAGSLASGAKMGAVSAAESSMRGPQCDDGAHRDDDDDEDFDGEMAALGAAAMDESGFFVIGDDDIGAGIIDKKQHEPLVRRLINEPINIIENHFKMKRPRLIPEALATSLERYVLEEMTLVVNLYGGRDFDDESATSVSDDQASSSATTNDLGAVDQLAFEATNELLSDTTISTAAAAESQSLRSRAGSVACGRRQPYTESSTGGSLKRNSVSGGRARRKHLSEGSGGSARLDLASATKNVEQRVRFGEGAVNLWESLDLMSAPDFLGSQGAGAASRPVLSSESKQTGGTWRENDVCIQLTLSKVKVLYELAEATEALASSSSAGAGVGAAAAAAAVAAGGISTKLSPTCRVSTSTATADSNLAPGPISWRFMLFIQDIEVKDRIAASDINKMLYEYCNESMPKRNTQMLTVKNVATINPCDGCEECDLRVSLKPLRLNIDQDTLLFLIEFFTTFCKSLTKQQSIYAADAACAGGATYSSPGSHNVSATTTTTTTTTTTMPTTSASTGRPSGKSAMESQHQPAATLAKRAGESSSSLSYNNNNNKTASGRVTRNQQDEAASNHLPARDRNRRRDSFSSLSSSSSTASSSVTDSEQASAGHAKAKKSRTCDDSEAVDDDDDDEEHDTRPLPTHCHTDCDPSGSVSQQPIYIKSFTFSPDVPIRIDYHAKHLNFEQGALAGILMGLAHLDHSELILRRVKAKHGMRGLDRVLVFAINAWLNDIKRNQLPGLLGGVGPMHSVIQLFQGMRDLVWMPIDHYRKDGRLVRGLQRGASSFSSSTAMAAINLVNRFISIVQCTAQIAHDIVTPPTMSSSHRGSSGAGHRRRSRNQRSAGGASQSVSALIGAGLGGDNTSAGSSRRRIHHYNHSAPHSGHLEVSSRLHGGTSAALASGGLNQPRNFCEGVAVGFSILKDGFNDTARNVTVGMQADDMRSAVGELVRQIPSTLLNPIISATEGAQSVLVGIRNQIAPDARRDDQEKWKGRVRGK